LLVALLLALLFNMAATASLIALAMDPPGQPLSALPLVAGSLLVTLDSFVSAELSHLCRTHWSHTGSPPLVS